MTVRGSGYWIFVVVVLALGLVVGGFGALWWSQKEDGGETAGIESSLPPDSDQVSPALSAPVHGISESRHNAITRAAAEVGPAVVTVSGLQTRVVRARPAQDDFWSQFFTPRYYREKVRSVGSGIIVSPDGYILTNDHVTAEADSLWVTLSDGRTFSALLVGSDRRTDLAVLHVVGADLPAARLGNSDSLLIGEWAIALGNPFGYMLDDTEPTVTVGVISAIDRDVKRAADDNRVYRKVIQTDAAINPGNSGGPLVNAEGEVVGINSFIFSSSRGSEGIGFAIPVNQARVIFADLVRYGEVRPVWVGVRIQPLHVMRGTGRSTARGVVITGIQPGSPAERAGLKAEDVIRRAGGRTIANMADWEGVASYWRAGQKVEIEYLRDEETLRAQLELADSPLAEAESFELGKGLRVANLTGAIVSQLALTDSRGAVVVGVEPDSPAEAAGFERGDLIRQVNNTLIDGVAELEELIQLNRGSRRLFLGLEREGRFYLVAWE
jgi:serine protease Do